jgi:tetratricopeptide (TPR) repeat protein
LLNANYGLKVPIVSAEDILNDATRAKRLKGIKAVVIATVSEPVIPGGATQLTVYGNISATPAVWVAHELNALANGEFLHQPYWAMGMQRLLILILAVYLILLPNKLRGWVGFSITVLLSVLIINIAVLSVFVFNIFQPLVIPALFVIFGHFLLSIHFKIVNTFKSLHMEAANAYRELGLNLQSQGRLDQAFNYMRKCEMDNKLIECLYNLGLEFERRRQFNQAVAVYDYNIGIFRNGVSAIKANPTGTYWPLR